MRNPATSLALRGQLIGFVNAVLKVVFRFRDIRFAVLRQYSIYGVVNTVICYTVLC